MSKQPHRPQRLLGVLSLLLLTAAAPTASLADPEAGTAPTAEPSMVPASFDFDGGLQGWTVEDVPVEGCDSTEDTYGAREWVPSSWEHRRDTDGYDGGLQRRGQDPGDHHMAVVNYRNCSDTRLVSPQLSSNGSPVTFEFSERHFTERDYETGDVYDALDIAWRAAPDTPWQPLDRCHGRGRYPLWDPVTTTFTPDGDFQVSFRFTSDSSVDGRDRWSRTIRTLTSGTRQGLGVWIDDVSIARGERATVACVPHDAEESNSTMQSSSEDGADQRSSIQAGGVTAAVVLDTSKPASPTMTSGSDPVGLQVHELLVDRMSHPEYQSMLDQDLIEIDRWLSDPYRWGWDGSRGRMRDVWLLNRYATPLAGTMYAPLEDGRHPTVVFVGGAGLSDHPGYGSLLQRLAEDGYVVLSVSPQGYLGMGDRQSAVKPAREFCGDPDATADAWWRQPQEAGLVETGFCAGEITDVPDYDCAGEVDYTGCIYIDERTGNGDAFADYANRVNQEHFGPSFTFAITDALEWLLGPDNPWRHLVDRERIATAGHSAGGFGAMVAANVHPEISAAVALDPGGRWPEGLDRLDTPTLVIGAESSVETSGGTFGIQDPADTTAKQNQRDVVDALRDRGVDTGWVVLADATHNDFEYLPYPQDSDIAQNSRWALPVTHHYLLAWFDHHLKGLPDARDRLLADTFDATADRTAIGVGRWNAIDGNVPYRIEGRAVAQHLSERFPNWIHLDGRTTDLR